MSLNILSSICPIYFVFLYFPLKDVLCTNYFKICLSSLCIYIYTYILSFIHFYRLSCRFQYALLIYFYRFPNNGKIVQNFGFIYPLLIFVIYSYLWLFSFFLSYLLLSGIKFFLPEELFLVFLLVQFGWLSILPIFLSGTIFLSP